MMIGYCGGNVRRFPDKLLTRFIPRGLPRQRIPKALLQLVPAIRDVEKRPSGQGFQPLPQVVIRPAAGTSSRQQPGSYLVIALSRLRSQRLASRGGRSMTLRNCHQKTIAVIMEVQGQSRNLRGSATYLHDPTLGRCLSIEIEDPESRGVTILLREGQWRGQISLSEGKDCFARISVETSDP